MRLRALSDLPSRGALLLRAPLDTFINRALDGCFGHTLVHGSLDSLSQSS